MNSILIFNVDLALVQVSFLVAVVHIVHELQSCSAVRLGCDCDCDCVEAALRSVLREILVWCMFNFIEPDFGFNQFCLTLIGCMCASA